MMQRAQSVLLEKNVEEEEEEQSEEEENDDEQEEEGSDEQSEGEREPVVQVHLESKQESEVESTLGFNDLSLETLALAVKTFTPKMLKTCTLDD